MSPYKIVFYSILCSIYLYAIDIRVGYDTSIFQNASKKEVALSTDLWFKTVIARDKYSTNFKIYDQPKSLAKAFKKNIVNLAVTTGDNLIKYYDRDTLIPAFTAAYKNDEDQYLVVVTDKKHQKDWQTLYNPKVGMLKNSNIQRIFFEYSFFKHNKKTKIDFEGFSTPSRILLKLFFGKLDCALIPYRTYKTVIELNPQITKKVVIAQKTKLTSAIFAVYRKGMDRDMLENINTDVNEFIKTDRMKDILQLYKMELLKKTDLSQLEPIKELLKNYQKLIESSKDTIDEKAQ